MVAPEHFPSALSLACAMALVACSCTSHADEPPDSSPPCVAGLKTDCQPLYDPPLYSTLFTKILQPTCATGTGTCHTAGAAMGGLVYENVTDSYDALLGLNGARRRVVPNDPACSLLMIRLESTDPQFVMPKGSRLDEPALCDFVLWIAEGAQRN